ncbi:MULTISPECIES: TonB-dependent receptor domain-containing protein [unclassified Brevundimonas]|uniref:TonB-dependent receptor domain-containing protein n=1 Tax=unclassified Brevundimonas TaxID=2622653 RepID=UPI0006F8D140|nr:MULTISPECIES: TonB-dependent receptor [unclassified Brevundimonas]KQY66820.1 TonB-dependent receptor [Brevundimonas sp. Root1423]KRA22970.1 TonB-dependent receptor [Brevundimonas sp. Root608]
MKTVTLTLSGVLLATSALIAPGLAYAQTPPVQAAPQTATAQTPAAQAEPQADDGSQLDEVVVLGRYIPEPNRESAEVAAFLTAEDLQRTGDSSAAGALARVTGLTVVEGRFVYVRGLGERYSSALLNGSPLPSPEPLQRVVPLDLFPSSILESVTVQKSYSVDFPGEFGGGVIDLRTVDAPNEPFFSMSASVGGNTETTNKESLIYYGSRTDFTGFDDGTRDVPGPLALAFERGVPVNSANFEAQQLQRIGQSLINAPLRLLQRETTPVNFGFDFAGGLKSDSSMGTFGLIAVAGYSNSWSTRNGVQEEGQFSGSVLVPVTSKAFESNQNDIQLNFLGGLSLTNENSEIKWTNFFVRNVTKEARISAGPDFDAGGEVQRSDFTEWFERQLFSSQLAGEHEFMDGAVELAWRAAYAKTERDAPYETRFEYGLDTSGNFVHEIGGNRISFSELDDDIVSGGADLSYTLPLSDYREAVFSVGVAYSDNNRDAQRRDLQFVPASTLTEEQRQSRVDYLYSDFNIRPDGLILTEITGGAGSGAAAYSAQLEVAAAYAQVDAEIIPLVRTTFGVRYEDGQQSVITRDLFGGAAPFAPTEIEEQYFLPSFTATWNFAEDQQLRLGASQTIGRPQFRELAPQSYTDPETDREFTGNPFLVDTEILNLDARYEWFFARQQFLTAGVFYKDLDKPVESTIVTSGNARQQSFINSPQATIYGAEIEAKKFFEFPDAGMAFIANKRWLVQANYTWSDSEVNVEAGDIVRTPGGGGADEDATFFIQDGSRLQGQSEHVANLQLGWEDDTARSQATIIVNYVSERISARGAGGAGNREPDFIQDPGIFLDFVYRKDFEYGGRDLGFALELRNLLNTDFDEYQELGNKILINNYELGSSASVSLTARF